MRKLIYVFLGVFMFALNISAQTSWILQGSPSGENLSNIQFVSATEGWISATNGKLLHTTNGGNNWTLGTLFLLEMWTFTNTQSMCFANPSTGWAIRTQGTQNNPTGAVLFKTINGGLNWIQLNIPNFAVGLTVQFVDANNGWILLSNATFSLTGFYRTTNGGTNWSALPNYSVNGMPYFFNSNTGWLLPAAPMGVGTSSDTIRKTTNGGLSWTAPWGTNNQVNLNAIHFSDVNNGWIVGHSGVVLKTTNGGTTWNYITNTGQTSSDNSGAVYFLNANTGWIGTKNETTNVNSVLYTNNGGVSWTWQTPPIGTSSNGGILGIHFYDALNGGLCGREGKICHTTNGGILVKNISSEVPDEYSLSQNYPNPFNPTTKIKFSVPQVRHLFGGSSPHGLGGDLVQLKVYDVMGREVQTLVNEKLQPGTYEASFDASALNSGVYFYKLITDDFTETKRMILLK